MGTTSAARYLRREDHVVWKVIEEKGILLNLEDGAYFEANPVGLAIWQLCDGRRSSEAIATTIAQEFRTPPHRVTRDLHAFVTELRRRKLLRISEAPAKAPPRL